MTMSPRKIFSCILLAALTVGFYANAHAANDDGVKDILKSCSRGAYDMREWTCLIEAFPEPRARQMAKLSLEECARSALMHESREWHAKEAADCAVVRAYIKRRWGVVQ